MSSSGTFGGKSPAGTSTVSAVSSGERTLEQKNGPDLTRRYQELGWLWRLATLPTIVVSNSAQNGRGYWFPSFAQLKQGEALHLPEENFRVEWELDRHLVSYLNRWGWPLPNSRLWLPSFPERLNPNQCCFVRVESAPRPESYLLGIHLDGHIIRVNKPSDKREGEKRRSKLQPRSEAQCFMNALLDLPHIELLFAIGPNGTGKTTSALCHGLESLLSGGYEIITFFRLIHAMGNRTQGFLPGDENQKNEPWMRALVSCLQAFDPAQLKAISKNFNFSDLSKAVMSSERLHFRTPEYSRGENIRGLGLLDDCQNADPDLIAGLIGRFSDPDWQDSSSYDLPKSRVILLADPFQVDYRGTRDPVNSGVLFHQELYRRQPSVATVFCGQIIRSGLAELAFMSALAKILGLPTGV